MNQRREAQKARLKEDAQDLERGEEGNDGDSRSEIECLDGGSHWPEVWMSFCTKEGDERGTAFAGAHMRRGPDRQLWVGLTITCDVRDRLVQWGIRVHLNVFNERYGAHNPGTLDLFFSPSGVDGSGGLVSPLTALNCEFLGRTAAEQFVTRYPEHPAFAYARTRSNLALIEFESTGALLEAHNPQSFADADLLRMSQEKSHIGPSLTDALTAFRRAASMAGRVRIVAYMTEEQQRRLSMKTIPAMAMGFELIQLLENEEEERSA